MLGTHILGFCDFFTLRELEVRHAKSEHGSDGHKLLTAGGSISLQRIGIIRSMYRRLETTENRVFWWKSTKIAKKSCFENVNISKNKTGMYFRLEYDSYHLGRLLGPFGVDPNFSCKRNIKYSLQMCILYTEVSFEPENRNTFCAQRSISATLFPFSSYRCLCTS